MNKEWIIFNDEEYDCFIRRQYSDGVIYQVRDDRVEHYAKELMKHGFNKYHATIISMDKYGYCGVAQKLIDNMNRGSRHAIEELKEIYGDDIFGKMEILPKKESKGFRLGWFFR